MEGIWVVALQIGWTAPDRRLMVLGILVRVRCGRRGLQLRPKLDPIPDSHLASRTTTLLAQTEGHLRVAGKDREFPSGALDIFASIVGIQMEAIRTIRAGRKDNCW